MPPRTRRSESKTTPKSTPVKVTPKSAKSTKSAATPSTTSRSRTSKKPAPASPTGLTSSSDDSSSSGGDSADAFDPSSDDALEEDEDIASDDESLDSDHLDEEESVGKKRKSRAGAGGAGGSAKKGKTVKVEGYEEEDEEDQAEDVELEEGQEIAGRIYQAPKSGQVPAGQISRNTFNFLRNLQIPERNDRDWFKAHEPAFRQAEKVGVSFLRRRSVLIYRETHQEWQAFVAKVQKKFQEADIQVPILPPKDIIHRIYRDVRFSSDKTPYKKSFSLSTSRSGRKGIFACYHLSISPNDKTIIACGVWQPGKDELACIRQHLLSDPRLFRKTISAPEFVRLFGEAKVGKGGKRQNVFGGEDMLKVAPKGVDKTHKDIDLLKLRSVAVVHHFNDDEVLAEDFGDKIKDVVTVMAPFVHLLNDMVTLPNTGGANDAGVTANGDDAETDGNDNGGEVEEDD
ncbi:hypothetical protein P7C73_g2409, partial [Tremellales sp. Uapishka_1]